MHFAEWVSRFPPHQSHPTNFFETARQEEILNVLLKIPKAQHSYDGFTFKYGNGGPKKT